MTRRYALIFLLLAGCAHSAVRLPSGQDYDLILDGTTVAVRPIVKGSVSDAIAANVEDLSGLKSIVYFRIDKIHKGKLENIKIEPPSRSQQIQDAVKRKEFLKVLDYDDTPTEFERQRFRIAVTDSFIVFGVEDGEEPAQIPYRLYLSRYKTADTFVLKRHEELPKS